MEKEISMIEKESKEKVDNVSFILQVVLNVIFVSIVILIIYACANKAYEFTYQIYGTVTVSEKATVTKKIDINNGDSALRVADRLYKEGIIVNKYSFFVRLKLSERVIQPQKYELKNNMTYDEIIDEICLNSMEEDVE